jgi:predicted TIM-barrel fold metal-dependent hydrolase
MIIDAHAHAFPSLHDHVGYASAEEHMRAAQVHVVAPSQAVIETATGRVVTEPTLSDGKSLGWSSLLDVNFRYGKYGRMQWTRDGRDYHLQMFAPTFPESLEPEKMLALMQYAGVGKAMLHNAHMYGMLNDYLGEVIRRFPGKFAGTVQIHEADCDREDQIRELKRAVEDLKLTALHFQIEGFFRHDFRDTFDDPKFDVFWEEVRRLAIPVLWNIRPLGVPRERNYVEQVARLGRWAKRWKNIPSVFTHGVHVGLLMDEGGRVVIPAEMWETLELPNMHLELLFPVMQGARWDYPFPEAQELIRAFHKRLGASKMLWGSDYPTSERAATYPQSLDYVRKHCTFLSASDKDQILCGTAARLYRFPEHEKVRT